MTVRKRVENILKVSRKARNSDKALIVIYMQKAGMNLSEEQVKLFKSMPSTETLRRIRQSLQQQGKYPADESVNEARYKKFKHMRRDVATSGPDLIERVILPWGEG